ncbi:MAG: aminotransferase class V-fold PLP-dependent enzyme [Pseudomonadota bacterium]
MSAPAPNDQTFDQALLAEIRAQFLHVDHCPIIDERRVFLESGGGSLKLKAAIEAAADISGVPDQEGRDNDASRFLSTVINKGREDLHLFFGSGGEGQVVSGETGTELLYKFVRAVALSAPPGPVISSNLEHPATFDAARQWADYTDRAWKEVEFDALSGTVRPEDYARAVTPDTRIATVIHTSQLTGFRVDLAGIVKAIHAVSPDCFIIADGIQQAPHGDIDVRAYGVDAYVFSPYKAFSRLAVGFGWVGDRLSDVRHDHMLSKNPRIWELGSRDPGIYAAQTAVIDYLAWLGAQVSDHSDRAGQIRGGAAAMAGQERALISLLLDGEEGLPGLFDIPGIAVIGPRAIDERAGIVSFTLRGTPSPEIVRQLADRGIRVHARIDDGYSGHILAALDLPDCVRVALCHYNSADEIRRLLTEMASLSEELIG